MKNIVLRGLISFAVVALCCFIPFLVFPFIKGSLTMLFLMPLICGLLIANILWVLGTKKEDSLSGVCFNILSFFIWSVFTFSTFGVMYKHARDNYDYLMYLVFVQIVAVIIFSLLIQLFKWYKKRNKKL